MSDSYGAPQADGLLPTVEPVPVSPLRAAIPSAREPWAPFIEMKAWKNGRRGEVLMVVASGMELYRGYVANAQQEYETHCAVLADFMAAFTHLSTLIASEAAAAFDQPASAIEARQGGDGEAGSVHESAAPQADAQPQDPTP